MTATSEPSAPTLHVFTNGFDWIVAESAADAARLAEDHHGGTGDGDPDEWEQLSDKKLLPIYDTDDRAGPRTTKTCAEWARDNGRGFLCTTEF